MDKLNQVPQQTSGYQCQECKDEYWTIFINDDGQEVTRPCRSCKRRERINYLMQSSRITKEFQSKRFDNFDLSERPKIVKEAKELTIAYANNFDNFRNDRNNSICLLGQPGSGKTHLMCAVANELILRSIPVLYFPWVEGLNEMKDDFSKLDTRIREMQKVDVLFIDDLFKGRRDPTEFQIEQAFAIINTRYMEKKPMLISSERDLKQIIEIDEALGSRIYEMCKDFWVVMKGVPNLNYRMKDFSFNT